MLTIEEIREKMGDRNIAEVARRLDVTRAWLADIIKGRGKPSYSMLEKISDYLEGK